MAGRGRSCVEVSVCAVAELSLGDVIQHDRTSDFLVGQEHAQQLVVRAERAPTCPGSREASAVMVGSTLFRQRSMSMNSVSTAL